MSAFTCSQEATQHSHRRLASRWGISHGLGGLGLSLLVRAKWEGDADGWLLVHYVPRRSLVVVVTIPKQHC